MWANLNLKSLQDKFQESLHDLESSLSAVAPPSVPPPPGAASGSSQPSSPSANRTRPQPPTVSTRQSPARTNSGGIALPLSPTSLSNAQQSASQLADSALSSLRASLRKGRQSFDAARASLDGGVGASVTSPTARRTTSMDSVRSQTDSIKEREMEDRSKGKGKLEELQEREEGEGEKNLIEQVGKVEDQRAASKETTKAVGEKKEESKVEEDDGEDEDAWGVGGGDDEEPDESETPKKDPTLSTTDILLDLSTPSEEAPPPPHQSETPTETSKADDSNSAPSLLDLDDSTSAPLPDETLFDPSLSTENTSLPPPSPPKPLVNPILATLQQESVEAEKDLTSDTPRPSTMGTDLPEPKEEEIKSLEDGDEEDGWDLPEVEDEGENAQEEEKSQKVDDPIVEEETVQKLPEDQSGPEEEKPLVEEKQDLERVIPTEEPKTFLLDPLSEPFTPSATPPVELGLTSPPQEPEEIATDSSLTEIENSSSTVKEEAGLVPPVQDADDVGPSDFPKDIEDLAEPSTSAQDLPSSSIHEIVPPVLEDPLIPIDPPSETPEPMATLPSATAGDEHSSTLEPPLVETSPLDEPLESTLEETPSVPLDQGIELLEEQVSLPLTIEEPKESALNREADDEKEIGVDTLIVEPEQPTVEQSETNTNREKLILDEVETVEEPLEVDEGEGEEEQEQKDEEVPSVKDENDETEAEEEVKETIGGDVEPELLIEPKSSVTVESEDREGIPKTDSPAQVEEPGLTEATKPSESTTDLPGEIEKQQEEEEVGSEPRRLETSKDLLGAESRKASDGLEAQEPELSSDEPTTVEADSEFTVQEELSLDSTEEPEIELDSPKLPELPSKDEPQVPEDIPSTTVALEEPAPMEDLVSTTPPALQNESTESRLEPETAESTLEPTISTAHQESTPSQTVGNSEPLTRERSVSVSQDPRFIELTSSHERLQTLKSSLDSLLTELIPSISSVDDTEALGAELRNLKVKADMGMDEVRRMSGQLDQQKSRIEELRETHRLEHQSQQSEIDALRDSLAARNASLEEANDKLAAAEKSAEATRQEILKAAEEYDKLKLVAKEEEEKRVKALSLLRALRQKLVKNEQEKAANDQELEKSRKAEKDALDTLRSDRARFDKEIVALRTAHEAQLTKLRTGFEREAQSLKERFEKEANSKRGQFELDAIHVKAAQAKELSAKDARIAQLESAVKDLTKSRDQVFEEAQKKAEEIESTKADEAALRGRTTELEYELKEAKDRIAALSDELEEVKRWKRETSRDDSNARKLLAETEARYESRIRELESRAKQLEKDRQETEEEMGRNMQDRLKEVERMRAALAQKDLDYSESVQNSQKREAKIAEAEKAKTDLEKRLKNLEEMLKSVKEDADKATSAEIAVREELGDRVQRAAELEARLEEVQAKESSLRSNNKTLREELRKLQSGVLLSEKQRHPGVGYFSSFNSSSSTANGNPGSPEPVGPSSSSAGGQVISPSASVSSLASAATGGLGGTARANGSADEALNFEYLRNVILQFLEKPEMRPHLISVLGVILHFTPSESRRLIAKAGH